MSIVDDSFSFKPARLVVEQGDWVRWTNTSGFMFHTTTSGVNCLADGLWDGEISSLARVFTRRFVDPPSNLPYYCQPHCTLQMVGSVLVTEAIKVSTSAGANPLVLEWAGGSGVYQVFRSARPGFQPAETQVLPPDQGDAGTMFTDATLPPVGRALFYLVMNKF
jgi:plastocyanin